jgi:hypothetical protein
MSVQTQIDRISGAVQSALAALTEKGVTVPDGTKVDGLAALIAAIEAGGGGGNISMSFGNISPAEQTGELTISHGLGKTPNFFAVFIQNSYSGDTSSTPQSMQIILFAPKVGKYGANVGNSKGTTSKLLGTFNGSKTYDTESSSVRSGTAASSSYVIISANETSVTAYTKKGDNNPKFIAAGEYRWIAISNEDVTYWETS